jgi:hypothetical protein
MERTERTNRTDPSDRTAPSDEDYCEDLAMRDLFFKLLPYITGAALGFLVFFPPDSFAALGAWRPLVLGALLVFGLLATTGVSLATSLPREPRIEPLTGEPTPHEVAVLLESYRALGFELLEPPLRIGLRPSATLWMLAHRGYGCWGSVFRTGTLPARVGFEMVSQIEGDRGRLSSVADPDAAILPPGPGHFKQVLRGASPAQLLAYHMKAHAYLAHRGVRFEAPHPGGLAERVRRSMESQRRAVMRNPLKAAALALWRATTKSTPYGTAIEWQKGTEATLRQLR